MVNFSKIIPFIFTIFIFSLLFFEGCKKAKPDEPIVYGCTSECSDNYNADANTDDGSCIPSRDKFFGTYSVHSTCIVIGSQGPEYDTSDYSMIIEPNTEDICKLNLINNFDTAISIETCSASNERFYFPSYSYQHWGYTNGYGGSGMFTNDTLFINTYFNDYGLCTNCCTRVCIKQ